MKKYGFLILGIVNIVIGIIAIIGYAATQNLLIGIFGLLIISGGYILYKSWKMRGVFISIGGKKQDTKKIQEPNTLTWYGVWDPLANNERAYILKVEYVENPPGRPWAWENLGDKPFYQRLNVPIHSDDVEINLQKEKNFREIILPDKKFLSPAILAKLLTLPNYTKFATYFKQDIDRVPLMLLVGIIIAEIIGLVVIP